VLFSPAHLAWWRQRPKLRSSLHGTAGGLGGPLRLLARANEVLQSGDGQAWAKFAAVTVFAGDCIVLPAGASIVGPLEDFWGRALRIHRKDDEASYLAYRSVATH
jgi:hypothetical protein